MEKAFVRGRLTEPAKVAIARALRCQMTCQERVLWRALRGNRMDGLHFCRQQIVGGYIVDFYCHRARLAIEVDGPVRERQPDHDESLDSLLSQEGINLLRISAKAIDLSPDSVLWLIRQHARNVVSATPPNPLSLPSKRRPLYL